MTIELKGCPFCGCDPVFPSAAETYGTCYDAGCESCGVPVMSIQMIDCFDYGESPNREDMHNSWNEKEMQYGLEYIEMARNQAIEAWNKRAEPVSQWISVNERLPEHGVKVLILHDEGQEVAMWGDEIVDVPDQMGCDAGFYGESAYPARSMGAPEYMHDAMSQPTHWQPLPPLPVDEG